MTRSKGWFALVAAIGLAAAAGCGGSSASDPTARPGTPSTSAAAASPATTQTSDEQTAVAANRALTVQLSKLRPLVLGQADVPFGFQLKNDQAISKDTAAQGDATIAPLAAFLNGSDLTGVWAKLFTREQPPSALSSIVYLFGTPTSAGRLVSTIAALTTSDYLTASSVERVQSDKIGDSAQMMRYRTSAGRSLEYIWSQGRFAGEIVLRYSGDIEAPDDVAQVVALARKQFELMAAATP